MQESELIRWLFLSFIGLLQFFAVKYVSSLAETVTRLKDASTKMLAVVAGLQRDVDFLLDRTHRRRDSDSFSKGVEL